jgi:hypothetical protein
MKKETGNELHVWKSRKDCSGMNYEEIMKAMTLEAQSEGFRPCDLNWKNIPNIYFRGKYVAEKPNCSESDFVLFDDGFIMFVEKIN